MVAVGVHFHMGGPVHGRIELFGHQQFAGFTVKRIAKAVTIEVGQQLARLAVDLLVGQDVLVDAVKVPFVMGRHLIEPLGHAGIGVAGHDGHRPLVVARTLRRVPGRGVAGAVIDQVQVRVIGIPAPGGAAADLPLVAFPAVEAAVGADGLAQMGGLFGIDQHFVVGTSRIGFPCLGPVSQVQGGQATAHPVFTTRDTDHHLVLDRHHGRGQGFADRRIADLGGPLHFTALGIQRHHGGVCLRQKDHPVGIGHAAVDGVAAHDRDDFRILLGFIAPQDLAVVGQIQGEDIVGERRVDIHDVPDHQGAALVTAQNAGREGPGHPQIAHVFAVDLVQFGITMVGVIAGLDCPLFGLGRLGQDAFVGIARRARQKQHGDRAVQQSFHGFIPPLLEACDRFPPPAAVLEVVFGGQCLASICRPGNCP